MEKKQYALFKRLMEKWQVDPDFRSEADNGSTNLFPPEEAESMLEAIHAVSQGRAADLSSNPYALAFCERFARANRYVSWVFLPESFHNRQIYGYLQRIRNRCRMESSVIRMHQNIYYFPIAFELSHGCRIGCDFCGLMAERWTANAAYDRALWRGIIQSSYDLIGPVVGECPCYFATEPLDNPDYLRFLADVEEITGRVPQTTTAAADREPERLRSLIQFLGEDRLRNQERLRISIRSLSQFRRITEWFSPEEFAYVEMLPNNRESVYSSSDSGRNRRLSSRRKIRYSISCMTGVKVNLADRSMAFVEPVLPDDSYPTGLRTLETVYFEDVRDYREKLADLYRRYAFADLPEHETVRIHPYVQIIHEENQIVLAGDGVGFRVPANRWNEQMLNDFKTGSSFEQVFQSMKLPDSFKPEVYSLLNKMYRAGYLV